MSPRRSMDWRSVGCDKADGCRCCTPGGVLAVIDSPTGAQHMCYVLALVQDWASSAAVPLMGGPRVGATSNP